MNLIGGTGLVPPIIFLWNDGMDITYVRIDNGFENRL